MINRVLIRIKVVQLLYSYLLLDNKFEIESQPAQPTKEKRFAYKLYIDMLVLMAKIAGRINGKGTERLRDNLFIHTITTDERLLPQLARYEREAFPFDGLTAGFVDKIKNSALFKKFIKTEASETPTSEEVLIWKNIFDLIIAGDATLNAIISSREGYTLRGVDRMHTMIDDTFKSYFSSQGNAALALRQLQMSLNKARDLYFLLLQLAPDLTALMESKIEERMQKYLPTEEERNPNLRFVENEYVARLSEIDKYQRYVKDNKISWIVNDREEMGRILKTIVASDLYKRYMEFPATDFEMDCEFWENVYKQIIFVSDDFLELLEDKSVFWNDDLDIMGTFVLKTMKRIQKGEGNEAILDKYKDEEDARFGADLFAYVVQNKDLYREYIDEFVNKDNWDIDRLAFMDVVILLAAIAEVIWFPKIPISVTVNEYIEIAKAYSTPKSAAFVHGLLGAIVSRLHEQGVINKSV